MTFSFLTQVELSKFLSTELELCQKETWGDNSWSLLHPLEQIFVTGDYEVSVVNSGEIHQEIIVSISQN